MFLSLSPSLLLSLKSISTSTGEDLKKKNIWTACPCTAAYQAVRLVWGAPELGGAEDTACTLSTLLHPVCRGPSLPGLSDTRGLPGPRPRLCSGVRARSPPPLAALTACFPGPRLASLSGSLRPSLVPPPLTGQAAGSGKSGSPVRQ